MKVATGKDQRDETGKFVGQKHVSTLHIKYNVFGRETEYCHSFVSNDKVKLIIALRFTKKEDVLKDLF